jgi:arylsulfatase A-like enzyme
MNLVVLMLDTVRPDHLGVAGHPVCRTPALDRLAAGGAWFANAYAEYPVTVPSRTACVAGVYTFTNRPWTPLRPYDLHLAEICREHGWRTAAFTDSPFRADVGMDRGFEEFHEFPGKLHPPPDGEPLRDDDHGAAFPPGADVDRRLWRNCVQGFLGEHRRRHGRIGIELMVDEAIEWVDRRGRDGTPFLLWCDSFQPHEPWIPPAPFDTMYQQPGYAGRFIPLPHGPSIDWMSDEEVAHVRALHMGEVTYTDMHVGRLLDHLDARGLTEDTLVIAVSDHGQPLGEHGTIRKFGVPVYDELSKIVLTMRAPSRIPAGVRVDALAQNVDILPTVLEMCGLRAGATRVWAGAQGSSTGIDGVSLAPLLRGETETVRDAAYMGAFGVRAAVRRGDWKFVDHRGERANELFDLGADPGEHDDRAAAEPERAAALHRELWEFCSRWSGFLAWRDRPAAPREAVSA